jgi:hypothetical protein
MSGPSHEFGHEKKGDSHGTLPCTGNIDAGGGAPFGQASDQGVLRLAKAMAEPAPAAPTRTRSRRVTFDESFRGI